MHSNHLTHPKYRADIDGLRAIAVLSVVGFHAFPSMLKGGFTGVDIFFVISGFLISTIIFDSLERNSFSFMEFYGRRIKRIFPALSLVLITSLVLGWFVMLPDEYEQLGKHTAVGAGFVSNFLFWKESGYFDNAAETKPLLHLWSLGIEEQFYIVWPLLLWFVWKKRFNLLTLTIVITLISFKLNIGKVRVDQVAAYYLPQTRFWELLVGAVLAYITLHKSNILSRYQEKLDMWLGTMLFAQAPEANGKTLRNVQSVLGAALIVLGVFVITKDKHFPGWWALLPTLGALLVISAGAQAWLNRTVLSHRILVWFGLISFPLYLWHWPLLSFVVVIEGTHPAIWVKIAAIAVSVLLAWLTYLLVEKPIRNGRQTKEKTFALLALMLVIGCVGYYCYLREGFGYRFPKIVQELNHYKVTDPKNSWRAGTCHLLPKQDYTFFHGCEALAVNKDKKTLLLWGDSHAAHLYAGYNAYFGQKFNIAQRTSSSCPPILHMEINGTPYCKKINDYIFESIKSNKPDKVVLAANWVAYDWKKIEVTVNELRAIGVTDIDLIGSVPHWIDTLPKQLYLSYKSDRNHRIPKRMKSGLEPTNIEFDTELSDLSAHLKVNYISPIKILCNTDGCITMLGDTGDTLTAFDAAHLTEMGSRYLVSQFPNH